MKYEIIFATNCLEELRNRCNKNSITLVKVLPENTIQVGPNKGKKFNTVVIGSNNKTDKKILEYIHKATAGP